LRRVTAWDGDGDAGEVVFDHFLEDAFEVFCLLVDPLDREGSTVSGWL